MFNISDVISKVTTVIPGYEKLSDLCSRVFDVDKFTIIGDGFLENIKSAVTFIESQFAKLTNVVDKVDDLGEDEGINSYIKETLASELSSVDSDVNLNYSEVYTKIKDKVDAFSELKSTLEALDV